MERILEAFRRLAGSGAADRALRTLSTLLEEAADLAEARARLAAGAQRGDLDHLIDLAKAADKRRKDWKAAP